MRSHRIALRTGSLALLLAIVGARAGAQYPLIARLDPTDPLFQQQQEDVRRFYQQFSAGNELPPLLIYTYTTASADTLFGLAARLSVPYSAIATLNRLDGPRLGEPGTQLLLPSIPGVFVPLDPASDLEAVMHDLRRDSPAQIITVSPDHSATVFRFFAGDDFLPEERSTFLGLLFRAPLRITTVTSPYGHRHHPLTGTWGFHAGVDFAAPRGTPVAAARTGTVAETGHDAVMGNYVLLDHAGGFATFYGHLDSVAVSLKDDVRSGMIIGTVGSSGKTTGAHLHFEIRQDGVPRDPLSLLP